jgi:hypothetical protein
MSSKLARKLDYARERVVNAYWMVKEGNLKLIVKSIQLEIHYRMEDVREWIRLARLLDDSQVLGSNYANRRKVLPPSPRPTVSILSPPVSPQADPDAIATELRDILSSLTVRDIHNS